MRKPSSCGGKPSGGKAEVATRHQAKTTLLANVCIGNRDAFRLHGQRAPEGANTTCIFHIFGSLILRCYIYICICSNGGYKNSISRMYCAKSFDVLIFHKTLLSHCFISNGK